MLASWPIPADHDLIRERCTPFALENGLVGVIEKSGRVIGSIGCARLPEGDFGMGYGLHPDHWGQGFATEMAGALIAAMFRRADCDLISAGHFTDNPASRRVLAKLGFCYTHTAPLFSKGRGARADCAEYHLSRARWLEFQGRNTYRLAPSAAKDKT